MKFGSLGTKLLIDYFRWTATATVLAVFASGYFFLIDTRVEELRTSGYLERAKVEAQLVSEKDYLQKLRASLQEFDRVLPADRLATIDAFLPTGANFPGLLLTVNEIAQTANLDLDAVAVGLVSQSETASAETATAAGAVAEAASIPGANLQAQDVTITVSQGDSYETFKRFIELLETSQRLFDVISVQFDHPVATESNPDVNATYTVTIRTYYLPTLTP